MSVDTETPVSSEPQRAGFDKPGVRRWALWAFVLAAGVLAVLVPLASPLSLGIFVFLAIVGVTLAYLGLRNPLWAMVILMVTIAFRIVLQKSPITDPFLIAFAGFVVSAAIWLAGNPQHRPRVGAVEVAMVLYVAWNVYSMLDEHELPALDSPILPDPMSVERLLLVGIVIPFVVYYVSRGIFTSIKSMTVLLATVLAIASYNAAMSIMSFHGPRGLVWPRYILEARDSWGRADGLTNQAGANGVVLITGFVVAVLLVSTIDHPRWRRLLLWAIAGACAYSVYLTHTRAVYLGLLVVLLIGTLLAKGFRRPFVTTLAIVAAGVALNWSAFISSDRNEGGVASKDEVFDRLNSDATALWGFVEKPWTGWGLGRFVSLNTYHHQRWSQDVPWTRGYGIASHFNELGILAELGIVGLILWLAVLFFIFVRLVKGIRVLPSAGLMARPLVLSAFMSFSALVVLGIFADLRLLDHPNVMTYALAGAAVGAVDRYAAASHAQVFVRLPRMRV